MEIRSKTVNHSIFLLTTAIFAGLLLPFLVMDGMFLDGITYSAIANNMARGFGSFWHPHYTQTLYPDFHEQPSLALGIQALFFKVIGESIYVERFYSLLTAVLSAYGITCCWKLFTENEDGNIRLMYWLPICLWILTPLVFWSHQNNLLENTMGVFTIFSAFLYANAYLKDKLLLLIPASLCVVMAFFTKGFAGLFPLITPALLVLCFRQHKWKKAARFMIIAAIIPLCIFSLILLIFSSGIDHLEAYFHTHVIPALKNEREITTDHRLQIIGSLLMELTLPLTLLLVILPFRRPLKSHFQTSITRKGLFFLFIGMAASLPLMISLKQRTFYLGPSIPFYILAVCTIIAPVIAGPVNQLRPLIQKRIRSAALVLWLAVILTSFYNIGRYSRDKQKLEDIHKIITEIPPGTIIGTTSDISTNWSTVAYFSRLGHLSLDADHIHPYLLTLTGAPLRENHAGEYIELELGLQMFRLMKQSNGD
ncbi:MAG: glycosyltransferase family 39 protein [Flavobacteriales bacterium]|nr:glycosyltransferase family 39 protein [Flavobacteriales bacterium]